MNPLKDAVTRYAPLVLPPLSLVALAATWNTYPPGIVLGFLAILLFGSVFCAVHHAEVVAHRVGEPFGSLILAFSVTAIEVALILTLMLAGGDGASTLARDTVFAAVMISLNLIIGLSLLVSSMKYHLAVFNPEGSGAALSTIVALATLCLVLPRFTTGDSDPAYTGSQLAFAAVASLVLYVLFVFTQTVRHRDFFLPVEPENGRPGLPDHDADGHADAPSNKATFGSLGLLLISLIAVVGLAKVESPAVEGAVSAAGLPLAFVGVVIACVVLLPETIAAVRAAARDRVQVSLNLAFGSAMASIGLTIPTLAVAMIWMDTPLELGLSPVHQVLLIATVVVSTLTVVPGRAKPLQGGVHLVLAAAYLFLSMSP